MQDYLIYEIKQSDALRVEIETMQPECNVTDHRLQEIKQATIKDAASLTGEVLDHQHMGIGPNCH
jgi:hypothetical protein